MVDSKLVILSTQTQRGSSNSEVPGRVIRISLGCWTLVCLLFAFPAAAQRVILHVDGQVPATPFAMANTGTTLGVLGLEQWPDQDQETTHEAIRAFAEFREAM